MGDVVSVPLAAAAARGSRLIRFRPMSAARVGERVTGADVPAGTVVAAVVADGLTLSADDAPGILIDLCPHDDAPAFAAAQAALPHGGTVCMPEGRYYLGRPLPEAAGITYRLDGASIARGGAGIPDLADQSQAQGLAALVVSRPLAPLMQEKGEFLSAYAMPTGSHVPYQKNAQSILVIDADPYVRWRDGAGDHVAGHDMVGQFIAAEMPPAHDAGGLWATNWVLGLDAGSRGGAILQKAWVINRRAAAVTELDDLDPVSGYDWIFDGTARSTYGLLLQGNVAGGGPGLENGLLFRRGAIRAAIMANRTAAYAGADSHVDHHLDNFHVMQDGSLFAQALHVGGGGSVGGSTGEALPPTGLSADRTDALNAPAITASGTLDAIGFSVAGNANGAVALGSRTTTRTALIDFGSGSGSSCRVFGSVGSNLDVSCLEAASGQLDNDAIFYPGGVAFQVPARVPALVVGRLDAGSVTTTGIQRAVGGIVSANAAGRTLRHDDCGTTIRDDGAVRHMLLVPAGLAVGCRIDVLQEGAGAVTIAPAPGETIDAYRSAATTPGLHADLQILVDTDTTFNVHP